jgi:hypothetical protein
VNTDIEIWRLVVEHWRSQGKDLRFLEVPRELAEQLGVPLELAVDRTKTHETEQESEDTMAKKTVKKIKKAPPAKKTPPPKAKPKVASRATAKAEPVPVSTSPEDRVREPVSPTEEPAVEGATEELKWKKRREFEGDMCGYAGCTKKADGYVSGIRSTKEGERDRRNLWYGPACVSCVRKRHPSLNPVSLAELAHQRTGASDLASVLDIEVGEVHKRLLAAGVDERGQSLTAPEQQGQTMPQAPGTALAVAEESHTISVAVPYSIIGAIRAEMSTTLQALQPFVIRSQEQMDYASKYMQRVKGLFNDIEERRKDIARPFREVINTIQAHFNPVKADLQAVELALKSRIDEAYTWSQQQQAQSFAAAQGALAAGNTQGVAVATQQAMGADLSLAKGVSMQSVLCFEITDASRLPGIYWSPDAAKIQAALDSDPDGARALLNQGYEVISGVRVWVENIVKARAA